MLHHSIADHPGKFTIGCIVIQSCHHVGNNINHLLHLVTRYQTLQTRNCNYKILMPKILFDCTIIVCRVLAIL